MALAKGAKVLNQNGMVYNDSNMDRLLFERALGQQIRRSGKRYGKVKKRTKSNDTSFEKSFMSMIDKSI